MNASYKNSLIHDTLNVLEELSRCEPRTPSARRTNLEAMAQRGSNWSMILAVGGMLCAGGMALWSIFMGRLPDWAKFLALVVIGLSVLLALLALAIPIVASAITLIRWKSVTLINLQDDIRHEQAMAYNLSKHRDEALADARCWLELKIKRIEARVSHLFGEKAAVLGLLTTSYFFAKEFGGLNWITSTISTGATWDNLANTALLMLGAGVLGMSLGAVMIRHIAARYRYQVELLDMACR